MRSASVIAERPQPSRPTQRCAAALRRWLTVLVLPVVTGCAALPVPEGRLPSQAIAASEVTPLARLVRDSSPEPSLTGVRLLPTGPYALSTRAALARRAQSSLD